MDYVVVKWLHVLSSTLLFGTGIGSAFYLFVASRRGRASEVAFVARYVVMADWLFTATTVVFQPLSGFWLARTAHFSISSRWLVWSIALYVFGVACWIPVVGLQRRMRDLAAAAARDEAALPPAYRHYFRIWVALGVPAFFAFVAVFWLMVAKPT